DGIRDPLGTGVQTCALPTSGRRPAPAAPPPAGPAPPRERRPARPGDRGSPPARLPRGANRSRLAGAGSASRGRGSFGRLDVLPAEHSSTARGMPGAVRALSSAGPSDLDRAGEREDKNLPTSVRQFRIL